MKRLFILGMLTLMVCSVKAQIGSGRLWEFDVDTLTNTDTAFFLFPKSIGVTDEYEYLWQFDAEQVADTTNLTVYVQEQLFPSGDLWINRDTVSISGSENVFFSGTVWGGSHRLQVLSHTNLQTSRLHAIVRFRKKRTCN